MSLATAGPRTARHWRYWPLRLAYHHRPRRFASTPVADEAGESSSAGGGGGGAPRLSVAVVGAGPAGFYTAKYLASSVSKRTVRPDASAPPFGWSGVDIDVIERLPTPYGLVRYGVAPDHPEVKNVENDFASLLRGGFRDDDSAPDADCPGSSLSYFGNVDAGRDVSLPLLQSLYDVVVLAYGCQSADRRLGIPGEDALRGVMSAREFVAWYNGHPDFGHVGPEVERCLWGRGTFDGGDGGISDNDGEEGAEVSPARVVVVGQGNVALDCARILAKGAPGLSDTDAPTPVLRTLRGGVSRITILGRRGHVQGAFTIKELRELTKLDKEGHSAAFVVRVEDLDAGMTESSSAELKGPSGRPKVRMDKLLRGVASSDGSEAPEIAKQVHLRFLMNPVRFEPKDPNDEDVGKLVCERTKLEGKPFRQKAVGTGETEIVPADLVLVSIGYRGTPLEGMEDLGVFDHERGIVLNDRGKVAGDNNLFVAGWIKRGPTGIIGTNVTDARETVASVMEYVDSGAPAVARRKTDARAAGDSSRTAAVATTMGRAGLVEHLRRAGVEAVGWRQYLEIDAAETDPRGLRVDAQPREKLLSRLDMLDAAFGR